MLVVVLLFGLLTGYLAGWWFTSRSFRSLVASIDAQNARLLNERRDHLRDAERLKGLLEKADSAISIAKAKRDEQSRLIIDLTGRVDSETVAAKETAGSK